MKGSIDKRGEKLYQIRLSIGKWTKRIRTTPGREVRTPHQGTWYPWRWGPNPNPRVLQFSKTAHKHSSLACRRGLFSFVRKIELEGFSTGLGLPSGGYGGEGEDGPPPACILLTTPLPRSCSPCPRSARAVTSPVAPLGSVLGIVLVLCCSLPGHTRTKGQNPKKRLRQWVSVVLKGWDKRVLGEDKTPNRHKKTLAGKTRGKVGQAKAVIQSPANACKARNHRLLCVWWAWSNLPEIPESCLKSSKSLLFLTVRHIPACQLSTAKPISTRYRAAY